ncbi:hypothetical protein V8D89_015840 [Ganoderma adspersum]
MRSHTIPKPSKVSTRIIELGGKKKSLATQMCLDGSRSDLVLYFRIVTTTVTLCNLYFPHHEQLSGERKGKVEQTLRVLRPKLLKEFPVLYDYADCWPVAAILRRHYLLRTQQGPQSKGIVCSASRQARNIEVCLRRINNENIDLTTRILRGKRAIYSWVKEGALTELQFQMLLEGMVGHYAVLESTQTRRRLRKPTEHIGKHIARGDHEKGKFG